MEKYLVGNRKIFLAMICIIAGTLIDLIGDGVSDGMILLVVGVYGCFVLGNIGEHISKAYPQKNGESNMEPLSKILEYQESSIKALEYLVSFVRKEGGTK